MKHYVKLDISLDKMPTNRILRVIDFELITTESLNERPLASRATRRMLSSVLQRGGGGGSAPLERLGQLSLLLFPRRDQLPRVALFSSPIRINAPFPLHYHLLMDHSSICMCIWVLCAFPALRFLRVPSSSLPGDTDSTIPH